MTESDQTIDCIIYGRPRRQSELSPKTYRTGGEAKVDVFTYMEPLHGKRASLTIGQVRSGGSNRPLINSPLYVSDISPRFVNQPPFLLPSPGVALLISGPVPPLNTV